MDHDLGQRAVRRENEVWELSVATLTAVLLVLDAATPALQALPL